MSAYFFLIEKYQIYLEQENQWLQQPMLLKWLSGSLTMWPNC